jgi:predicted Zn finger-like uncharacterized protein
MSMITTCPKCHTAFRVSSQQLNAREGKVRCGRCSNVFNGFMHLTAPEEDMDELLSAPSIDIPPAPVAPPPVAPPPSEKIEVKPFSMPPFPAQTVEVSPPEIKPPLTAPDVTAPYTINPFPDTRIEIPDDAYKLPPDAFKIPAEVAKPAAEAFDSKFFQPFPITLPTEKSAAPQAFEASPLTPPERDPFDDDYDADMPPAPKAARPIESYSPSAAPVPMPKGKQKKNKTKQPAYETSVDTDDAALDLDDDADSGGPTLFDDDASRARPHWLWGAGAALLLVSLAAQGLFFFRQDIAQALPAVRPLMQQACEALSCKIPLSQNFELLSIEASELVSDPQKPEQIELRATVRNRARFVQAFPNLDLSLTDAQDQTLVKRVIAPEAYLAAPATAEAGFAPNSEISVKLPFNAVNLKPAGYRLLLFYP